GPSPKSRSHTSAPRRSRSPPSRATIPPASRPNRSRSAPSARAGSAANAARKSTPPPRTPSRRPASTPATSPPRPRPVDRPPGASPETGGSSDSPRARFLPRDSPPFAGGTPCSIAPTLATLRPLKRLDGHIADAHLQRTRRHQRLQPQSPLSVFGGLHRHALPLEIHFHALARVGPPPDAHRHSLLEHHMVRDQRR